MTEILILMKDFPNDNLKIHCQRYHRGDIIDWRADGWPWSEAELSIPKFRHIRIGLTDIEVSFLARSEGNLLETKSRTWARRRFFDWNLVKPGKLRNFLDDNTRATPILILNQDTALNPFVVDKGNADDFVKD